MLTSENGASRVAGEGLKVAVCIGAETRGNRMNNPFAPE
jgi:hypothetical protein